LGVVACHPSTPPPLPGEVTAETPNPFSPFSEPAREGGRLFLTNCATCHGYEGLGDGPSRGSLVASPANLTRPPVSTFSDGRLFLAIKDGKRNNGKLTMPPILKMTDEEIWKTVAYLRQLSPPQTGPSLPDRQKVD
jgi:mono/diheme cytochrome c family protein